VWRSLLSSRRLAPDAPNQREAQVRAVIAGEVLIGPQIGPDGLRSEMRLCIGAGVALHMRALRPGFGDRCRSYVKRFFLFAVIAAVVRGCGSWDAVRLRR
jgi:hypothetical protein